MKKSDHSYQRSGKKLLNNNRKALNYIQARNKTELVAKHQILRYDVCSAGEEETSLRVLFHLKLRHLKEGILKYLKQC